MDRNDERTSPQVIRVRLPSGKTIEVIRFSEPSKVEAGNDLHLCRSCRSELVYPTRWSEVSDEAWEVTLRCPECEEVREGVFAQDCVEAFDDRLEAGTEAVVVDLRRLTRANMADEVARFVAALAADAILPEDF